MNSPKVLFHILKKINARNRYTSKLLKNSTYAVYLQKNYSTQNTDAQELVTKEKIQVTKPTVTKWKRPPFVKNFFLGKFDTELLAFPEILNNELLEEIEKYVKSLNELYTQKVNSCQIDETGKIPDDLLQDLKDLGLFGRMIPTKYGGLDLTYTACTRLNEVIGLDWSLYSLLTAHEFLSSRLILMFGSEEQKTKYLPLLATGKKIAAFCAAEPQSGSELISITSTYKTNMDGSYLINGTKCWVTNAEMAGILVVFAKSLNPVDPNQVEVSAFIVDRNTEGISIKPHEKMCLKGVKTSMVNFNEVIVPKENLVGSPGAGCTIFLKAMEDFRIAMNSFTFGTLKVLLDSVTQRIINTERFEQCLGDLQLVRVRLSRVACRIYAMESMSYFTAAILDSSENPDVSLESAILKLFNSEGTMYCIKELIELIGSTSLMKEQQLERFYRDALGLHLFDGPNDVLRLFIGYSGCKLVGDKKAEDIMKAMHKFFFPFDAMKNTIKRARHFSKHIKYDQDLAGHMHPSLVLYGNLLEEKLQKFELAVEEVLTDYGKNVLLTQLDPRILADTVVYIYAQAAVLSRASRSYCIGLKNATHEIDLASAFCYDADQYIYNTLNNIFIGVCKNNEGSHLSTGEQVIDCRGYFPEHPLKHNF